MDPAAYYALGLLLAALLAWLARRLGWLDRKASLAAAALGALVWASSGLWGSLLLVFFVVAGSLAARLNPRSRDRRGRTAAQVLANGLPALLGALACGPAFFAGSLAAVTADTLASELGALSPTAWRYGRGRVPAGTNAAVSLPGSLALLAGAGAAAFWAPGRGLPAFAIFAGGVFGAVLDTITGPLEERLSWWNNDLNNALAATCGGLLACWLA